MVKNFEDMFIRFDRIHEYYRETEGADGRTPHDTGRAYTQHRSRGKNLKLLQAWSSDEYRRCISTIFFYIFAPFTFWPILAHNLM